MAAFIDQEREVRGVESVCKVLPIAPSAYYLYRHLKSNPDQRCRRAKRDDTLKPQITRVYEGNHKVYGARKVWKQLKREDIPVARSALSRD